MVTSRLARAQGDRRGPRPDEAAAAVAVDQLVAARARVGGRCGTRAHGSCAVSAHPLPQRRGWLSALAAQLSESVFEEIEAPAEPEPLAVEPRPIVAVVSAARRSGAST